MREHRTGNLVDRPFAASAAAFALSGLAWSCSGVADDAASQDQSLQIRSSTTRGEDSVAFQGGPTGLAVRADGAKDPGPPDVMARTSTRSDAAREPSLGFVQSPPAQQSQCTIDFTDEDALALTIGSLWFDRVYVPWLQYCGGGVYADVRSLVHSHFHVGFADPDVVSCPTHPQAFPSRIGDDDTCDFVDVPTEPRTYLMPHWSDEVIRLRVYYSDYTLTAFDLNQVRVAGSTPIRLCYKKPPETDEPWETNEPSNTEPGVWSCWNSLGGGTWDLSAWVWDVMEVKITGGEGAVGPFALDDLVVVGP